MYFLLFGKQKSVKNSVALEPYGLLTSACKGMSLITTGFPVFTEIPAFFFVCAIFDGTAK